MKIQASFVGAVTACLFPSSTTTPWKARSFQRISATTNLRAFNANSIILGSARCTKPNNTKKTTVYYQPLFSRDDPSRMHLIKRKTHRPKNGSPHSLASRPTSPSSPSDSDGLWFQRQLSYVAMMAEDVDPIPYCSPCEDFSLMEEDLELILSA